MIATSVLSSSRRASSAEVTSISSSSNSRRIASYVSSLAGLSSTARILILSFALMMRAWEDGHPLLQSTPEVQNTSVQCASDPRSANLFTMSYPFSLQPRHSSLQKTCSGIFRASTQTASQNLAISHTELVTVEISCGC